MKKEEEQALALQLVFTRDSGTFPKDMKRSKRPGCGGAESGSG